MTSDHEKFIRHTLAVYSVPATETEIASLVSSYPMVLESLKRLHEIPIADLEEPATIFEP